MNKSLFRVAAIMTLVTGTIFFFKAEKSDSQPVVIKGYESSTQDCSVSPAQ